MSGGRFRDPHDGVRRCKIDVDGHVGFARRFRVPHGFRARTGNLGPNCRGSCEMMYESWCVIRSYCRRYVEGAEGRVLNFDEHSNQ